MSPSIDRMCNASLDVYLRQEVDDGRGGDVWTHGYAKDPVEAPNQSGVRCRIHAASRSEQMNAGKDSTEVSHKLFMVPRAAGSTPIKRDDHVVVRYDQGNAPAKLFRVLTELDISDRSVYERWYVQDLGDFDG